MQQHQQGKNAQLAERFAQIEERLTSLDQRVAGTNQGNTANLGWIPLLSPMHLGDLHMLFRSLEQATGRTQPQLEQEVLETFRVLSINAIPDE